MASLDYQLPGVPTVSLTAGFESTSSRTANAQDSLRIPARSVLHLGTRYRFKLSGKPVLLRANVQNVFNTFGWAVGGTGFLIPNGSRRYSLSLAADI
jgi:iron complex outermembrane receptor protein